MDLKLMELRREAISASTQFLKAQRAYLEASSFVARKTEEELKESAAEYLKTAGPYGNILHELRQYLLAMEPSGARDRELDRTETLIEALEHEKRVASGLVVHHDEM